MSEKQANYKTKYNKELKKMLEVIKKLTIEEVEKGLKGRGIAPIFRNAICQAITKAKL